MGTLSKVAIIHAVYINENIKYEGTCIYFIKAADIYF